MQQTASTLAPKTAEVPAAYGSLHSLDLTRSCPLTQPGQLAALAHLTGLRRLSLTAPDAQKEQLIAAELASLTQITALDLSGCVLPSPSDHDHIATLLPMVSLTQVSMLQVHTAGG